MAESATLVDRLDWRAICAQLDAEGYAVLPGLLGTDLAHGLARGILERPARNRELFACAKTGRGDCLHFDIGLPAPLQDLRVALYRRLAGLANRWCEILGIGRRYPARLDDFARLNREAGQGHAQFCVNRLGSGDAMPLHQRGDGAWVFPMQVVALLSEPGEDFTGGEFVMTEQRPRMQSRVMVLPLGFGDAAIIATAARPFEGANGPYRVNTKHGISLVRRGQRIGMELSFHDAREKLADLMCR
ncbi:2OG-Fe(II) oxygenase [Bordetella sp. FB-8]|uniref:2OG-Fe(II) oxygenase n=1 Tax=Bordetella sp. FB-8 TaxID=1159870 RepID=UPI00039CA686|nr:2OG-Fe(II) oxygenase [Bordetella sp. FB-8]